MEPILRVVFAVLPLRRVSDFVGRSMVYIYHTYLKTSTSKRDRSSSTYAAAEAEKKAEKMTEHLHTTEDFVRHWGFPFEAHYVTTKDGYILALHRIPHSRAEQEVLISTAGKSSSKRQARTMTSVSSLSSLLSGAKGSNAEYGGNGSSSSSSSSGTASAGTTPKARPVVLLYHGFMMCSEVWVCVPNPSQNLPFVLADAGYDVWLGNTRGNKYSCKHRSLKTTDEAFWDFSMDHLALHDLPDSVSYILKVTGAPSLSYIGFSQGTAQGFSALSMSRKLQKQINLFIALAPATKPKGIDNKLIHSLVNTSPEMIYLLFGRKVMLSVTLFWQSILSPATFAAVIDLTTWALFAWKSELISYKSIVYRHLYSYTSVKMVVHWFQIMRTGRFQMYDENPTVLPNATGAGHLVPKFPTEGIQTPIALFWGGSDSLPDMDYIMKEIPPPVFSLKIDEYEHLCFLWARGMDKVVFPGVLGLLNDHAEVWSEASSSTPSQSTPDFPASEPLPPSPGTTKLRTVPWISPNEIDSILKLGQPRPASFPTSSSTVAPSQSTQQPDIYPGRISVVKVLRRAASNYMMSSSNPSTPDRKLSSIRQRRSKPSVTQIDFNAPQDSSPRNNRPLKRPESTASDHLMADGEESSSSTSFDCGASDASLDGVGKEVSALPSYVDLVGQSQVASGTDERK
ncbi:cholesterol esterase [Chytridiales sp. JEL 0842]|nr:cholesterol esterase [Chytridiales sp. JEL 0842]